MKMYKYPEFKYPNLETYISELESILNKSELVINELLKIDNKTYDTFLKPYFMAYEDINNHYFYLSHINSVKNTDDTQRVETESLPIMSDWYTKIGQRDDIHQALLEVSKTNLNPSQRIVIEQSLLSNKLKGIGQEDSIKKRLGEISKELSELSDSFSTNLLKATKDFKLEVKNPEDVSEFPDDELQRHVKEDTDHWEFTLQAPSYSAYLKYGSNTDIREKLSKALSTRATENEELIEKILTLKNEKAKILGYKNYAEISILTKMADSPNEIVGFLDRLATIALPIKSKEDDELLSFTERKYGVTHLNSWDKGYYTNKYKESVYDFKSEDLKPYFEQSMVLNGLFDFLYEKFKLKFTKVDTYVWDEKVTVYDITRNGEEHSRVYIDLESRDDKRSGAWMNNSEVGYVKENGEKVLPIAYITCNFTPSTDKLPSLLSHYEVETLFHEMGHVLQHVCSEVEDFTYAGIGGIEWDAVEWSSQFLELFVYEGDVLRKFGKHHETGEIIPDEFIKKINDLRTYRAANGIIGQVKNGKFDMTIFQSDDTSKEYVQSTLDKIIEDFGLESFDGNKWQCGFSQIFAGGYSAGYYSYKWSEVLSVDTFLKFRENDDSDKYYEEFLSKGSSLPSMDMFVNYMGRKPSEESLVNYLIGLQPVSSGREFESLQAKFDSKRINNELRGLG